MLAKCATCNKTFIKKADETECPGCIISGPTKDLPPVVKQRREREIPDLREGRGTSPRGRGAELPAQRRFPYSLVLGVVLLLGGAAYTFVRYQAGSLNAYGPVIAFVGVLNVLFAIYDGSRRETVAGQRPAPQGVRRTPEDSDEQ